MKEIATISAMGTTIFAIRILFCRTRTKASSSIASELRSAIKATTFRELPPKMPVTSIKTEAVAKITKSNIFRVKRIKAVSYTHLAFGNESDNAALANF